MIYYNIDTLPKDHPMNPHNNNNNNGHSLHNQQLNSPTVHQHPEQLLAEESPYFRLMVAVGTHNRYQVISMVVWCILWLVTGTILLGTPFFMLNSNYVCTRQNTNSTLAIQSPQNCQKYVCQLPLDDRKHFIDMVPLTISNTFEDLHCSQAWVPDLLSSLVYLGCFFGYISISIMVDNMGRKKSILIAYGLSTLGMVIAVVANNLWMVGVGLFLMGYGCDSAINICFYFITETMETKYRQKYSILIQVFFSLGGVVNVAYFYAFKNWRIIMWIFLIAPSIVCIAIVIWIIKDTPYFMIKLLKNQQILQQLKHIYKINFSSQMIEPTESQLKQLIEYLKQFQLKQSLPVDQSLNENRTQGKVKHKVYTPLDLFRYPSIRFTSIAICLLSTFIYILYYGPLMLISKLSFNLYINALVVTLSELVTYPISYFLIHRIRRRMIGIVLYAISGITAFALIFVVANLCPEDMRTRGCHILQVFEMLLIFCFRFCSSLQFAIFLLYCNEAFPTQVRGMGIGISSALGTVASTASPYIFGSHINTNAETSRIMIVFVVISAVGVGLWWKLKETLGYPIQDQIKEVQQEQKQAKASEEGGHIELVEVKENN